MLVLDKPQHLINIPTEYLPEFLANSSKAWQSFGSFAQSSDSPFFENIGKVIDSIERSFANPFDDESHTLDPDFVCSDGLMRFIHVDLGLNKDACGIGMCHIHDWMDVDITKYDSNEKAYTDRDRRPVIKYDFIARIKAPKNGEIVFEDVREIIYDLTDRGFPIHLITYDGFGSIDSIQLLRRKGYIVDRLSMDRTATYPIVDIDMQNSIKRVSTGGGKFSFLAAWIAFKEAVNTGRVILPFYKSVSDTLIDNYGNPTKNVDDFGNILSDSYNITWIEKEMLEAVFDAKAIKVHETYKGSIDLLEGCAGALFNAINNITLEEYPETRGEHVRRIKENSDNDTSFGLDDYKNDMGNLFKGVDTGQDDSSWEEDNF